MSLTLVPWPKLEVYAEKHDARCGAFEEALKATAGRVGSLDEVRFGHRLRRVITLLLRLSHLGLGLGAGLGLHV